MPPLVARGFNFVPQHIHIVAYALRHHISRRYATVPRVHASRATNYVSSSFPRSLRHGKRPAIIAPSGKRPPQRCNPAPSSHKYNYACMTNKTRHALMFVVVVVTTHGRSGIQDASCKVEKNEATAGQTAQPGSAWLLGIFSLLSVRYFF